MDDYISRSKAIRWVKAECNPYGQPTLDYKSGIKVIEHLERMSSAHLSLDEWCTDCKEYDSEKHCCPRFNRVIRQAIEEAQPEIIRCKDCKWFGEAGCAIKIVDDSDKPKDNDFYSFAERKES